jgi:hypothetical protein
MTDVSDASHRRIATEMTFLRRGKLFVRLKASFSLMIHKFSSAHRLDQLVLNNFTTDMTELTFLQVKDVELGDFATLEENVSSR